MFIHLEAKTTRKTTILKAGDKLSFRRGGYQSYTGEVIIDPSDKTRLIFVGYDRDGNQITTRKFNSGMSKVLTVSDLNDYWDFNIDGAAAYIWQEPAGELDKMKDYADKHPTPKQSTKFIIWCPTAPMPPRVILEGEEKAREVAIEMSARHDNTFYWCRLEGKAEQKKTSYTKVSAV